MTFTQAVRTVLDKFAVFNGRARRSEYWWWVLFVLLVSLLAGLIDVMIFGAGPGGGALVQPILSLAVFIPNIAVTARRLHDIDRSGWWQLLYFVPIVGFLVMLYWLVQPSQPQANRFGPPPDDGGGPISDSSLPRVGRDQ